MKSPKTNPYSLQATRALRDYYKHAGSPSESAGNTFAMCLGFCTQCNFTPTDALRVIDEIETAVDVEHGKTRNGWRLRLRLLLTSSKPGRYGWNIFLRSMLPLAVFATAAFGQVSTNYPGQLRLDWDKSTTSNVTYRLWASNSPTMFTNLNTGTNLSVRLTGLQPGRWLFYTTAVNSNNVHSLPSNYLLLDVPATPTGFRNVVIQYSTNLTNFSDVGFFRLQIP